MTPTLKDVFVFSIGLISLIYLINPTAGIIELIPDNIPLVGNLDEAGASYLLLSALKYFNVVDLAFVNNVHPMRR